MRSHATTELIGTLNSVEEKYAPKTLWTEGDATLLTRSPRVAVVGTRSPTPKGVRRTRRLVKELVRQADAVIVSGLAEGVDTIAHNTAIELGASTIAVLGTPLDQVYPPRNDGLQRKIGAEHLLVSEFAPGVVIGKGNFPRRNRTMALITHATVIVEAAASSGTQSQGWEAIRLGRPLFLLQSLVDSGLEWPAKMVDHGAFVLNALEDLMDILPNDESLDVATLF